MTRQWFKETHPVHREQEEMPLKEMRTKKMLAEKGKRDKEMTTGGRTLHLNLGVELTRQEEETQLRILRQLNPKRDSKAREKQRSNL